MKSVTTQAKVLIATDNADDASQIIKQLSSDFEHLRASTNPDTSVKDFEAYQPDVLVLAFDSLDKAQRYYLGLYRLGQSLQQHPHRTVILCNKEEVRTVFDLCKKEFFDDYVLYWPHTHDGPRLAMTIWTACREMTAAQSKGPRNADLLAHAKQLDTLSNTLDTQFREGARQAVHARETLQAVEREVAGSIDHFSERLQRAASDGWLDIRDAAALARELEALKLDQTERTRRVGEIGVQPLANWAKNVQQQVAPSLAKAQGFQRQVKQLRPLVMAIDDDEMARSLIARVIESTGYELSFAVDGQDALRQLRRVRPDAILMDICLPGMDGLTLTQHIKSTSNLSQIPIIMMTGDAKRENLISSVQAGASGFVVKPFTKESLTSKLAKALSES